MADEGFTAIRCPAAEAEGLGHQIILAQSDGVIRQAVRTAGHLHEGTNKVPRPLPEHNLQASARTEEAPASLRDRTEAFIKGELGAILQVPAEQLESATPLSDYGVDSILAAQVTRNLGKAFGEVSGTLLFEHPTIARLSAFFAETRADRLYDLFGSGAASAQTPAVAPVGDPDPTQRLKKRIEPSAVPASEVPGKTIPASGQLGADALEAGTLAFLRQTVSSALQVSLDQLEDERPLAEYGLDSILAPQIARSLGEVLGSVDSTVLFEYPTITGLAGFFLATQPDRLRERFAVASAVPADQPVHVPGLPPPPRASASPAPVRPANSVRRTSSIDVSWPNGHHGDRLFVGRARDYRTRSQGEPGHVIDEAGFEAVLAPDRTIRTIEALQPTPEIGQLQGVRAGIHSRMIVARAMPALLAEGAPILLPLDDIPGTAGVSAFAWSYFRGNWAETMRENVDPEELSSLLAERRNVCWGLKDGSSGLGDGLDHGHDAVTGDLRHPDDPEGWHAFPESPGPGFRRARRIDVTFDRTVGLLRVNAAFQDSAKREDGSRVAIHEYELTATIDAATHEILSLDPTARVLPFAECPGAVANTRRLVGSRIMDIREAVSSRLQGPHGCTHLNDMFRALAEVPRLANHLSIAEVGLR